jgi:phosphatidylserine/phosphatidylglycerophosphate/cardiolipin synthase-like enzyme
MQTLQKKHMCRWLLPGLLGLVLCAPVLNTYAVTIEAGFSPDGSALQLVLKTIESAQQEIRLMSYSFTSPEVTGALIRAKRRGVDVRVVLDWKANAGKMNNASKAAMNLLVNASIPLRTNNIFAILHDKAMIVDARIVQTGSLNYTGAGARKNSENVLVIHDMPELAQRYLTHWQSRWDSGKDWKSSY